MCGCNKQNQAAKERELFPNRKPMHTEKMPKNLKLVEELKKKKLFI